MNKKERASTAAAIAAADLKETARIVNLLALHGHTWPEGRPRTRQKLYDAMCALRGATALGSQTPWQQWASLRRWVAEVTKTAGPRELAPFKPYVMPPQMRAAIERSRERVRPEWFA